MGPGVRTGAAVLRAPWGSAGRQQQRRSVQRQEAAGHSRGHGGCAPLWFGVLPGSAVAPLEKGTV